ncbi:MAG: endonuclease domain-containing protein [Chitinivibrionales bacterium]|nr:endonuclease domain-containing protein [Chitinivibrionales bacterium]
MITKKRLSGVVQLQRISDSKLGEARSLRENMTPAEKILWSRLRGKKCNNLKFRRQQIIEGFIVDFFCAGKNLVIELDGSVHDNFDQKKIDEHRCNVFEARGLHELRFRNEEVEKNLENVLNKIIAVCQ